MWRNPKYPPPPDPAPPEEQGTRLATFPRGDGTELRLTLTEFNGRPYLALRLWESSSSGWWPVKGKGCSIRLSEAAGLADVLAQLDPPADERPRFVDRRPAHQRDNRPPWQEGPRPTLAAGTAPFDELGGEHA